MSTTTESTSAKTAIPAKAWRILALGVAAQAAGTVFVSTPAFLIPLLHTERGLALAQAGLLASAPTVGMVLTLVAWGALADRFGERWVIAIGLALTGIAALVAMTTTSLVSLGVFLLLGGAAAASTNAASGRVVVGWFPKERRGLAMGIRQMSQPLGVTVTALTVPALAAGPGIAAALALSVATNILLAVLCAIWIANPPRPSAASTRAARDAARTPNPAARSSAAGTPSVAVTANPASNPAPADNPYRASSFLWRIHAVSVLLVLPQFTLSIFGIVWLVTEAGWSTAAAGVLIGASQFVGAIGRIAVGALSDRVGSRTRVLRWVAVAGFVALLLLAATDFAHLGGVAAVAFVIATTISVADNGLSFTSVAEAAGSRWSGKALGIQNTGQFVAASVVGPAVGSLITLVGYPLTFAIVALAPLASRPLVPAADRHHAA